MRLRATQQINSSYGTFPAGRTFSVPDDVGSAWVDARLAVEASEAAAAADETQAPQKPLHRMNKAELIEIAEALGLDTGGSNKALVQRITEARGGE